MFPGMFLRKLLLSKILILAALYVFSFQNQSSGEDCRLKAPQYADSIALLLQQGLSEKLPFLLLQWEHDCGASEPLFRVRMLQLISEGQFPGYFSAEDMLDNAVAFDVRHEIVETESMKEREESFELYAVYLGYVALNSNFDMQTQRWARRMLSGFSPQQPEWAWLQLYSGNPESFFLTLREEAYPGADLSEVYKERVAFFQRKPELNMGVGTGIWIPTSDLEVIGLKPSLDIFGGIKTRNTYYDLVFSMRFGKTQKPFELMVRDSIVETRKYQGGFLGLEITQMLIKSSGYEAGIFVSGGYDLIDIVEDRQNPVRETFSSPALHFGPVFTFNLPNRSRLSLKAGYFLINHQNTKGSSLDGNAWNLRVLFGFSDNASKTGNLKRLGY